MSDTILALAGQETCWLDFLTYKTERHHLTREEEQALQDFIKRRAYEPLCDAWRNGAFPASLPVKRIINKEGTSKKRVVYSFPGDEGIFLKFVAFQLYRFDGYFADNCYAFRRSVGVKDALRRIRLLSGLSRKYCLKVDVRNYFNSVDVERLLEKLEFVKAQDPPLYALFSRILRENRVRDGSADGPLLTEDHGAMAGTPISPFFANVYLGDVDRCFRDRGIPYFRYSDDILIFADTAQELESLRELLYAKIAEEKLSVNPEKVRLSAPGEPWEFLGFSYREGRIDLSPNTLRKTKAKIRRKADALRRWQRKKGLSGDKAAIGLIRAMNRKFYGRPLRENALEAGFDEFTWARWFFPNLTCDEGLREIDAYLQEYIRYAVTGRHYKGNYRIRYEDLKAWGYRSLVHEYYKSRAQAAFPRATQTGTHTAYNKSPFSP